MDAALISVFLLIIAFLCCRFWKIHSCLHYKNNPGFIGRVGFGIFFLILDPTCAAQIWGICMGSRAHVGQS